MSVDPEDAYHAYPSITSIWRHITLVFLLGIDWNRYFGLRLCIPTLWLWLIFMRSDHINCCIIRHIRRGIYRGKEISLHGPVAMLLFWTQGSYRFPRHGGQPWKWLLENKKNDQRRKVQLICRSKLLQLFSKTGKLMSDLMPTITRLALGGSPVPRQFWMHRTGIYKPMGILVLC